MHYAYESSLWITALVLVAHARWVRRDGGVMKQWDPLFTGTGVDAVCPKYREKSSWSRMS